MSMPIFAWVAYVYKASAQQNIDTLNMIIAASAPHMEKSDRMSVIRDLQRPLLELGEPALTKEEYIAQMMSVGIEVELN